MIMDELTPRQRRHLRTKDAILDAARQIISEDGIASLSMRGLADRIDYSAAGLYEYFGSKDEIITAVCLQGDKRLRQNMGRVDKALPPMNYLIEIGLAYIDFAVTNPDHFMLMFASGLSAPDEIQESTPELISNQTHRGSRTADEHFWDSGNLNQVTDHPGRILPRRDNMHIRTRINRKTDWRSILPPLF